MKTAQNPFETELVNIQKKPETKALIAKVDDIIKQSTLKVESEAQFQKATNALNEIRTKRKEVEAFRKKLTDPLKQKADAITELFKPTLLRLTQAEETLNKGVSEYYAIQRKKQEEEQQRKEEEAEKERQKLLERARQAEKKGNDDKAAELETKASLVQAAPVQTHAPVSTTMTPRDNWKFKIVDVNKVPREYMIPDEVAIGKIVRDQKGKTSIAGIEVYNEPSFAQRGGR